MVRRPIKIPIEEDGIARGDIGVITPAPLSVRLEPGNALGLTACKAWFGQSHLAVAPGHKAGAPFHTGVKAIPTPERLTAHIAHLTFRYIHHSLITGAGAVDKLNTGQTLGITGVCGTAAENQGLVAQRLPVHLVHFQLFRG